MIDEMIDMVPQEAKGTGMVIGISKEKEAVDSMIEIVIWKGRHQGGQRMEKIAGEEDLTERKEVRLVEEAETAQSAEVEIEMIVHLVMTVAHLIGDPDQEKLWIVMIDLLQGEATAVMIEEIEVQ